MSASSKFAEYVTSGAFHLNLTRSQVSALAMTVGGGSRAYSSAEAALERKGLVVVGPDAIRNGEQHYQPLMMRATPAGVQVHALCVLAGLANGEVSSLAAEMETLQAELGKTIVALNAARRAAHDLHVRLQEQRLKVENHERTAKGDRPKIRAFPDQNFPGVSDDALRDLAIGVLVVGGEDE